MWTMTKPTRITPVTAMTTFRPMDDPMNPRGSTIRSGLYAGPRLSSDASRSDAHGACWREFAAVGRLFLKFMRKAPVLALSAPCAFFALFVPGPRGPGPGSVPSAGAPGYPRVSGRSPPEPPQRQRSPRAVHLQRGFHGEQARLPGSGQEDEGRDLRGLSLGRAGAAVSPPRRPRRPEALGRGARRPGPQAGGEDGRGASVGAPRRTRPRGRGVSRKKRRTAARSRPSSTRSSSWTTSGSLGARTSTAGPRSSSSSPRSPATSR